MNEFQANSYWITLCNSLNGSKYLLTRTTWLILELLTTEVCETLSLWPATRRDFSQMATCPFSRQILRIFTWTTYQTPFPDASMTALFKSQFLQGIWEVIALPHDLWSLFWSKAAVSLCSTSSTVLILAAKKMELQSQPKETGSI